MVPTKWPIKAFKPEGFGIFKDADFQTKSEYLKKYFWSTFGGYCYLRKRNKNIDYDRLLSTYFSGDTGKGRRQFRQYVTHAIEGEIENPFEQVAHQSILGAQDFVDWVRQKLPRKGQREVPSLTRLQLDIAAERIIEEVAKAGNVQTEDLRDRKTKLKDLRQMAMELSYRYSNYKQKELGMIFGVDYSTVSQNRVRLKTKLKSNRKLKKQFHRILEQIDKLTKKGSEPI
jgi:Bacterial dnaA protein helix-turn-helix